MFAAFLIAGICALSLAVYYLMGWIRPAFGAAAPYVVFAVLTAAYVGLLWVASREEPLQIDDPNAPVTELPLPGPTVRSGLHFILPVVVLVWALMVDRLSPGLSAFWATAYMIFILLTQRPLMVLLRGSDRTGNARTGRALRAGFDDLVDGLISGARNMIGIGIATATAGIIVGAVSQTGVGSALAEVVEVLSGGHLLAILGLTAVLSLILGMGLPTTANYIVVSALLAPVIVTLGQQNGLIVPLIAVHLFVFYFGIMADVTPPVGLASFAAAAVSKGDPIKTGITAFYYSLRTAALPFLFIFNTDLLLIDVGWGQGIFVFITATIAMLLFAAATQGWFLVRSKLWETVLLLVMTRVSTLWAPARRARCLRFSSFHSSTSMASRRPLPCIMAARCRVLPPAPAQASMTRMPGLTSRAAATSWEPASCCSKQPSAKAWVRNRAASEVTCRAVSTPSTGTVVTCSLASMACSSSRVHLRVLTRR